MRDAAVRARLEAVRHDVDGLEPEVRDVVEVLHVEPRAVRGAGSLCADVGDDLELAEGDRPVLVHAHLHLVAELVAVRSRDEVLVPRVVHLDRARSELGEDRGVDLGEVDAAPVAVARPDVARLDHADLVLRDLERLREAGAHAVRPLARVDRVQLVVVPPEEPVRHLEGDVLLDRLVGDQVDRRVGVGLGRVAPDERRRDRDRRAVEVRLELLRRARLHRLEEVEGGRQHGVLDVDLPHRLVGDVLAVGRDRRDR